MPYKTKSGSHYHETYGCHGATISCERNGLEPCSDCCGGSAHGTISLNGAIGAFGKSTSERATSSESQHHPISEPSASEILDVMAAMDGLDSARGVTSSAPTCEVTPNDVKTVSETSKGTGEPRINPVVANLSPMTEKRKKEVTAMMSRHFEDFMKQYVNTILRKKGTKNDIVQKKRNNRILVSFMPNEAGIVYSALSRSFESALGKALETFGQECASLSYDVSAGNTIIAPLTSEQATLADTLAQEYYDKKKVPSRSDYEGTKIARPKQGTNQRKHETDNRWYDSDTKTHVIVELKAGGDLDNKKARIEKAELLREYFMQQNIAGDGESTRIFFATAYNKDGDDSEWAQGSVQRMFADDELLIGRDYWNLVCNASNGYDVIMENFAGDVGVICRREFQRVFVAYGISV